MKFFPLLLLSFSLALNTCKSNSKQTELREQADVKKAYTANTQKMVFQKGHYCYLYHFDKDSTVFLGMGDDPSISADGKWIAYTQSKKVNHNNLRTLQIIHIDSLTKRKSIEIDDTNHFGAIWSPKDELLAFNIMHQGIWKIGISSIKDGTFNILDGDSKTTMYSPTWSANGNHILVHDTEQLYVLNTNGKYSTTYDLKELLGESYFFSSADRFFMSKDEKYLIFTSGVDETIEGLNEPSSAIFYYDFYSKKGTRLSLKGLCAIDLWVHSNEQIYFSGFTSVKGPRNIYEMHLKDKSLTKITEGIRPSLSQ